MTHAFQCCRVTSGFHRTDVFESALLETATIRLHGEPSDRLYPLPVYVTRERVQVYSAAKDLKGTARFLARHRGYRGDEQGLERAIVGSSLPFFHLAGFRASIHASRGTSESSCRSLRCSRSWHGGASVAFIKPAVTGHHRGPSPSGSA